MRVGRANNERAGRTRDESGRQECERWERNGGSGTRGGSERETEGTNEREREREWKEGEKRPAVSPQGLFRASRFSGGVASTREGLTREGNKWRVMSRVCYTDIMRDPAALLAAPDPARCSLFCAPGRPR